MYFSHNYILVRTITYWRRSALECQLPIKFSENKKSEKPLLPTFNILSRELHVFLVCGPQIINVMFLISENEILRTICSLFRGRQNNIL